jgi:FkbH-like protein
MLLKWDDFALHRINWLHKHENLRAAAHELGLGLDSFVFIDDSDYEREQVRQLLPEVLVLNESADPLHILRSLWETDAFDSLGISEEDLRRHHEYTVRDARTIPADGSDLEAFLTSLEMTAAVEEIEASNIERVVTLLSKTNQFNLTTRRHSRAQLQAMIDAPGSIAITLRLADKFGDQGIVGVMVCLAGDEPRTLQIDTFLVSCRALGRGVEEALWAEATRRAQEQGTQRLDAEYIRSARNGLVAELYDRFGLERIAHDEDAVRYVMEPVARHRFPNWIAREEQNSESRLIA